VKFSPQLSPAGSSLTCKLKWNSHHLPSSQDAAAGGWCQDQLCRCGVLQLHHV